MSQLQYIMQLSAPPKQPVSLLGVFDPVTENPWWLVAGIIGGAVLCGLTRKRRRR